MEKVTCDDASRLDVNLLKPFLMALSNLWFPISYPNGAFQAGLVFVLLNFLVTSTADAE